MTEKTIDLAGGLWAKAVILVDANGDVNPMRVGGITARVDPDAQPVVTAALYSAGNLCGGKLKFSSIARTGIGSGMVQSAIITSKSVQTAAFDVILFNANPASTTFTDKAAFTIHASDQGKVIGILHANDVTGLSACSVHQALNAALPFALVGVDIYAAVVTRGTPTFASTSDLLVSLRALPD